MKRKGLNMDNILRPFCVAFFDRPTEFAFDIFFIESQRSLSHLTYINIFFHSWVPSNTDVVVSHNTMSANKAL